MKVIENVVLYAINDLHQAYPHLYPPDVLCLPLQASMIQDGVTLIDCAASLMLGNILCNFPSGVNCFTLFD